MDWESCSGGPFSNQGDAFADSSATDALKQSSTHVVTRQNVLWVWWPGELQGGHHDLMVNSLWDRKEEWGRKVCAVGPYED